MGRVGWGPRGYHIREIKQIRLLGPPVLINSLTNERG